MCISLKVVEETVGKKLNTVVAVYHERRKTCLDADVAQQRQGRRERQQRKRSKREKESY
jgi:hypothetical protein